jgi:hypothetical protein
VKKSQLETVTTDDLVRELKRRFQAIEEAKRLLLGTDSQASASRYAGRKESPAKSESAKERWKGWPEYKAAKEAEGKKVFPSDFFKDKKKKTTRQ